MSNTSRNVLLCLLALSVVALSVGGGYLLRGPPALPCSSEIGCGLTLDGGTGHLLVDGVDRANFDAQAWCSKLNASPVSVPAAQEVRIAPESR